MIGIVAVSHSARLGEAALELALQMVHDGGVRVKVAAGAGVDADGAPILGTDAVAVAAALDLLELDRAMAHVVDHERPLALAARHLAAMQ